MKFSAVVLIVPEEQENSAVDVVKEAGATGVTLIRAKGLGLNERKTFLGLGLERKESVLLCVVEKNLSVRILKQIKKQLELGTSGAGIAFSVPLENLVGLRLAQLQIFKKEVEENL